MNLINRKINKIKITKEIIINIISNIIKTPIDDIYLKLSEIKPNEYNLFVKNIKRPYIILFINNELFNIKSFNNKLDYFIQTDIRFIHFKIQTPKKYTFGLSEISNTYTLYRFIDYNFSKYNNFTLSRFNMEKNTRYKTIEYSNQIKCIYRYKIYNGIYYGFKYLKSFVNFSIFMVNYYLDQINYKIYYYISNKNSIKLNYKYFLNIKPRYCYIYNSKYYLLF
jgi:hypothetical protein